MKAFWKRFRWVLLGLIILGLIAVSLIPKPIPVDTAEATISDMTVAVEAEGVTRVRDLYMVAAPVSGELQRIELKEGEIVQRGTFLTSILPAPLNPAQQTEVEARIDAIEATKKGAEANLKALQAQLAQAQKERERLKALFEEGAVAQRDTEQAQLAVKSLEEQVEAAQSTVRSTEMQAEAIRTARAGYSTQQSGAVRITSPVSGTILRVFEKSERIVLAGTPIAAVGDPKGLEIVVDILSTDAVKIEPGARIIIDGWGGDEQLEGVVRYIEPSAFTKVSALGIQEQRVNVVGLFSTYPDKLGDGYRVVAKIVVWESDNVLQVPGSSLFREGDNWATFVIEEGVAKKRTVKVGHRNAFDVEIVEGLSKGDRIILHPSNQIQDGTTVEAR